VEVARLVALNAVSVGATLGSLAGYDRGAEVLVAGWPDDELLDNPLVVHPRIILRAYRRITPLW
jgi:hypothetical protein